MQQSLTVSTENSHGAFIIKTTLEKPQAMISLTLIRRLAA